MQAHIESQRVDSRPMTPKSSFPRNMVKQNTVNPCTTMLRKFMFPSKKLNVRTSLDPRVCLETENLKDINK